MPALQINVGCAPIASDDPDRSKTAQTPVRWVYEFYATPAQIEALAQAEQLGSERDPQELLVMTILMMAREKFDFDPHHEALVIEVTPLATA